MVTQKVNNLPAMQETQVQSLDREISWRREWQPTPVFLPGKSHGRGGWWDAVHRVSKHCSQLSDFCAHVHAHIHTHNCVHSSY